MEAPLEDLAAINVILSAHLRTFFPSPSYLTHEKVNASKREIMTAGF